MPKRIVLSVIGLLFATGAMSQHVDDILNRLREKYQQVERIEYTTVYELFKGHKSPEIVSSYSGYVYRDKKQMYQKIHSTEFVYGSDYFIKTNSDEKAIVLDKKQQLLGLEIDLDAVLKECREKKLKNEGDDHYTIVLALKAESQVPLSMVKLQVDKKNYTLKQLDLYYSTNEDFSADFRKTDLHQPHLRIRFQQVVLNPNKKDELFVFSRYLQTVRGTHSPTDRYKGYKLIDNRI